MEPKIFLNRFRIVTGSSGLPVRVVGGAGERTYKAVDTASGEEVALELVPAFGLPPQVLTELEAEAVAAKQLNHINIPKLYDFGFEGDHLVYASELFDGTTAEAWVTAHGPMPVAAALHVAQQVVGALGAATFHGILHHAINPRNLMIVPGQTTEREWPSIKVLNFVGVAPEISVTDTGALGAAHFASPEQHASGSVDFRSEIYSLGQTLSFLLTGAAPAVGAQNVQSASGIAAPVKHLIAQMVATDPGERPLDPLAFQRHIQDVLDQVDRGDSSATMVGMAPAAATPTVVKNSTPRAFPMKPLAWAALILTIATIGGVLLAAVFRSDGDVAANDNPIGVPIGIPERSALTAASETEPATAPTTESTAAPAAEPTIDSAPQVAANAANPPVVTSDPIPGPNDTVTPSTDAPAASEQPATEIASNDLPPPVAEPVQSVPAAPSDRRDAVNRAPVVASNTASRTPSETTSPAEGPDTTAAQPLASSEQPTASYADAAPATDERSTSPTADASSRSVAKTVRQTSQPPTVAFAATPQPKKTAPAATRSKRAKRDVQVADGRPAMPAIPRGAVRAEFLGTTEDGNLIFGLPASQRGYVAPGESRARRSRRVQPPPDLEVRAALPPVLPALPPDEEYED